MRAAQIMLALASPLAASAFLDRQSALLLSLPELRSPLQRHLAASPNAGAAYRHLAEVEGAFPAVVDEHEFIGATSVGFVVYNTSSVRKGTTVLSDDYLSLLSTATLTCAPRAVAKEHEGQGHVTMTIAFPAGASDAEALEHFAKRLALPAAVLALGVDTLLTHPNLDEAGSCVVHAAPDAAPFFLVGGVQREGAALTLELSPATHQHAFDFLAMHVEHSPDAEAETARRLAAGLFVGRKLGVPEGALLVNSPAGATWGLNTGATPGTAARSRIELFSNNNGQASATSAVGSKGYLFCSNCFYGASGVTLTVDLKVCGIVGAVGTTSPLYYDTTTGNIQAASTNIIPASPVDASYKSLSISTSLKGLTDCSALATADPASVAAAATPNFNGGFSATASLTNTANFNFNIMSTGQITTPQYLPAGTSLMAPATTPLLACTTSSLGCVGQSVAAVTSGLTHIAANPAAPATLVAPISPVSDVTYTFGSVPIKLSVTMALTATAKVDANANLNLRMGVAGTTAHKMVGTMSTPDFSLATSGTTGISASSYTALSPPQISVLPIAALSSSAAGGVTDVTITAQFKLTVATYMNFIFTHNFNMISTLGTGSSSVGVSPITRVLRESRALQSCPSGTAVFTPTASMSAGIFATPITAAVSGSTLSPPNPVNPAVGGTVVNGNTLSNNKDAFHLSIPTLLGISAVTPPTYISPTGVELKNYAGAAVGVATATMVVSPLATLMNPTTQNALSGYTSIPLPSGCSGVFLMSNTFAGPALDQGQIALIVVGVIPVALVILYALWRSLACACAPAPAPPAPYARPLSATSAATAANSAAAAESYDAYGDFKFGGAAAQPNAGAGIYAAGATFGKPASGSPGRSSPVPEFATALFKALPTAAFRMLKQKGALSARGEVLKAVVLTAEEEATLTTEQLVMLAEAGVVAE